MDGSKSQGQKECEEEEDKEESEVRCVALKAKLESVQRCTRRVKDMVGIEEAQEVLPKLEQQMGNMQHLLKARAENQVRQDLAPLCLSHCLCNVPCSWSIGHSYHCTSLSGKCLRVISTTQE